MSTTYEEYQTLFRGTVEILNSTYPRLKVRDLDSIIWQKYQNGKVFMRERHGLRSMEAVSGEAGD